MSWRLEQELGALGRRLKRGDPLWPAQLAVAAAIGLQVALAKKVTIGPTWLVPTGEALLLVALIVITPRRAHEYTGRARQFALGVIALVSLSNIVSLGLLVRYLINGGKTDGHALILSGAVLWLTNVLLFAVWYWEMDRGGPEARCLDPDALADFEFPQMDNPTVAPKGWRPGFVDYLYTSLTNATAFSPTDTMPLTQSAKMVMAVQGVAALATVGLVIARAVNILG